MKEFHKANYYFSRLAIAVATIGAASSAVALPIDLGNPDFEFRWDNTLRYNLGVRTQKPEKALSLSSGQQVADNQFGRGDVVANRLDLFSEADLIFKKKYGARVSASAWYDNAYDGEEAKGLSEYSAYPSAYPNGHYTGTVKRYYAGPSGEILDAFVFGGFDIGAVPVNLKLGRHNLYWGESLFSFIHGVSYAQGPVDIRKATATPGTEAKELFLPVNQFSLQTQVADNLSLAGYYQFEWEPSRLPEGGTYFGTADYLFNGHTNLALAPGFAIPVRGDVDTPKNSGAYGLSARWRPQMLDGTLGFYYREFSDTLPNVLGTYDGAVPTSVYNKYAEDVRLYGISLSKQVGAMSVGAELVRRENTALSTIGLSPDIARGDTWHALANVIAVYSGNGLWDSSTLQAELTYSRLDKVTKNREFYNDDKNSGCKNQHGGQGDAKDGCSTRDNLAIQMAYTPTWYQVTDGLDLSAPVTFGMGLYGTSPVTNGGNEGASTYSFGVSADYVSQYKATLSYNGFFGPLTTTYNPIVGQNTIATSSGGTPLLRDRGWVSLTLKASY